MEQLEARAAVLDRQVEGTALKMKENLSEACKAHEMELANMNAANAVMKAQLGKARADVKDLQEETEDRQAENSALRSHLIRDNERIKQLREELASNRKLLADNQTKDDEVIASGKAEIEALQAKVLEMEDKHT